MSRPSGRLSASEEQARLAMYWSGRTDREIATRFGIRPNSITVWRRARRLPPVKSRTSRLSPEQNAGRMLLYQLGWSDRHIGREQRIDRATVRDWRRSRGLPANFPPSVHEKFHPRPAITDLVKRVRQTVGRSLPPDIAEEAVSDLCVALLAGEISLDHLAQEARKFGNRVLERFANRYLTRSVDQELSSGEGYTLLDTLKDENSSSWLEEMGATVW